MGEQSKQTGAKQRASRNSRLGGVAVAVAVVRGKE